MKYEKHMIMMCGIYQKKMRKMIMKKKKKSKEKLQASQILQVARARLEEVKELHKEVKNYGGQQDNLRPWSGIETMA